MRVSSLVAFSLAVLSFFPSQAAAQTAPCGDDIRTAEAAIELGKDGTVADLRVYDSAGALVLPSYVFGRAVTAQDTVVHLTTAQGGCDYFLGFPTATVPRGDSALYVLYPDAPGPVTLSFTRTIGSPSGPVLLGTERFVYNGGSSLAEPESFFTPNGGSNGDVYFQITDTGTRVSPDDFWNQSSPFNSRYMDEVAPDGGWVFPYHKQAFCAVVTCPGAPPTAPPSLSLPFLMPVDQPLVIGQPLTKHLTPALSMVLSPNAGVNWTESWLTLAFAPGTGIEAQGRFDASGVTFTASDSTRGWSGIFYRSVAGSPTTASTLSGVRVSHVRTFVPPWLDLVTDEPIGAAVTAVNRAVVITGGSAIASGGTVPASGQVVSNGTVYPTNGVQVAGTSGRLTITGGSSIVSHGGVGVLATGGGFASVAGLSEVRFNDFGGVRATGYQSSIGVLGLAQVDGNFGAGVRADQQGFVTIRTAGGTQSNTSASNNRGGLYSRSGGGISGEQCDGTGNPTRPNEFENNVQSVYYDATAFGASVVSARYAFWGTGRTTLVTDKDTPSTLSLYPLVPTANTPQPGCPVLGGEFRAGSTSGTAAVALAGEDAAPHAARGQVSDAVVLLAAQAREAAWAGNTDAAFAMLAAARVAIATDDDREAVFEATTDLLAEMQPADVMLTLEADAAAPSADAAWAQRALAVAYATGGRAVDAEALAVTLIAGGDAAHAAFGHGLLVRLAANAGDEAGAIARLTDFAAAATEDDAEALGSAVALVAATFPEMDLSGVLGGSAGRGAVAGQGAADAAATAGKDGPAVAATSTLDVFPNPAASGQATLRVTLAAASAHAVATVYDALGRRVAVLHDGALAAGPHAFTLGALAPGVYVVHVRTSAEAGAAWTDVRRVTVTR